MKINKEIIEIITILDDYDCILDTIDVHFRFVTYYKEDNIDKIYDRTFEEILSRDFL